MDPESSNNSSCIRCTYMNKDIWSIFSESDDWNKYKSDAGTEGGFKRVYYHMKDKYVLKLVLPISVQSAVEGGIISEITFPIHIHRYGSEFMKTRTPRVIKYFKTEFRRRLALGILEELAAGEILLNQVDIIGKDNDRILSIICQGFKYIKEMHAMNIVHSDIKLENLLYDESTDKLTFIDFGLACTTNCCDKESEKAQKLKFYEACTDKIGGTLIYLYPMILLSRNAAVAVKYDTDIYSMVISSIILMLGSTPDAISFMDDIALAANKMSTNEMKYNDYISLVTARILQAEKDIVKMNPDLKFLAFKIRQIIIFEGKMRLKLPSADKVYSNIKKDCVALDKNKEKILKAMGFGEEELQILGNKTPEDYASEKAAEIESKQPGWWNLYGYI